MEIIDQLSKRIQDAAQEIINLKKERRDLQSELEYLYREQHRYQNALRDNERLNREQSRLRVRLERLNKVLEKHLGSEPALAVLSHHES